MAWVVVDTAAGTEMPLQFPTLAELQQARSAQAMQHAEAQSLAGLREQTIRSERLKLYDEMSQRDPERAMQLFNADPVTAPLGPIEMRPLREGLAEVYVQGRLVGVRDLRSNKFTTISEPRGPSREDLGLAAAGGDPGRALQLLRPPPKPPRPQDVAFARLTPEEQRRVSMAPTEWRSAQAGLAGERAEELRATRPSRIGEMESRGQREATQAALNVFRRERGEALLPQEQRQLDEEIKLLVTRQGLTKNQAERELADIGRIQWKIEEGKALLPFEQRRLQEQAELMRERGIDLQATRPSRIAGMEAGLQKTLAEAGVALARAENIRTLTPAERRRVEAATELYQARTGLTKNEAQRELEEIGAIQWRIERGQALLPAEEELLRARTRSLGEARPPTAYSLGAKITDPKTTPEERQRAIDTLGIGGGLGQYRNQLARRMAGGYVVDPEVRAMTSEQARKQFEALARVDPFARIFGEGEAGAEGPAPPGVSRGPGPVGQGSLVPAPPAPGPGAMGPALTGIVTRLQGGERVSETEARRALAQDGITDRAMQDEAINALSGEYPEGQ